VGADHAQHQLEGGADEQASDQHPQGRQRLVGDHAVVSLHHEQRHHQAEQVDQQAGQQGVAIQPTGMAQGVAEPGVDPRQQR